MLSARFSSCALEAGCDEAGRGCLAGPVYAAAVILPGDYIHPLLNDSKQLSEKKRYFLKDEILYHAIDWAVASVDVCKIDDINILNASILAMHKALAGLKKQPEFILIDGNRFKAYQNIPYKCMVKGDSRFLSIAAASILAKTFRDDFMKKLHVKYPVYHWNKNKGYATKNHRQAIHEYGPSPVHRQSFRLLDMQKRIDFPD